MPLAGSTASTTDDGQATSRIASYKAGLTAFRRTTAYWPPEFRTSPEHMIRLIENIVDAAFDAQAGTP